MSSILLPRFNVITSRPRLSGGLISEQYLGNGIHRMKGEVVAVLKRGGVTQSIHKSRNIVTDAGDLYYAELGVAATQPTNFTTGTTPFPFDGVLKMYKSVSAAPSKAADLSGLTAKADPTSGSTEKAATSGWPKVNDTDTDNTGKGTDVLTYKFEYTAGDWNDAAALDDGVITNPTPGASEALLCWFDGLNVIKSASDTLTVYVNHTLTGS